MLADRLRDAPTVRALGSIQYGPTARERDEWGAYDAMVNLSLGHLPAWVVCAYDGDALPEPVLEMAWRAHPEMLDGDWNANLRFEEPEEMIRELMPQARPLPDPCSLEPARDLATVRERLAAAIAGYELLPERALELLLAANELVTNASTHGGGLSGLRVGHVDGRLAIEVLDDGPGFDDPLAGYRAPHPDGSGGGGLWIARQLAWRVETLWSDGRFAVRLTA